MIIGIIGAGALGSNVAQLLAKSGISLTIAKKRGLKSLARLVREWAGPSIMAGAVEDAASADIVRVVVSRWIDIERALSGLLAVWPAQNRDLLRRVIGEFPQSRGDRRLIKSTTVLLPPI